MPAAKLDSDERDIAKNPTTLSGDIGVEGDSMDNSSVIVSGAYGHEGVVLDGLNDF